jgi:hypothetical protein
MDHSYDLSVDGSMVLKFILSHVWVRDYRREMVWWMDLMTTYTHHSELKVITALSLISTIYKSPQHPLNLSPACCVFISRSLATVSNSGDYSASRTQVLSSQTPVQKWTLSWQPPPRLAAISCQPPSLLFTGWLSTDWVAPIVFKIIPLHGPHRKHPRFHCCSPTVAAA